MSKSMLNDARQRKLISGLSSRIASLSGLIDVTHEAFQSQRTELGASFQAESLRIAEEQRQKSQQATTRWDLSRERAYSIADRQTLSSIQKEQTESKAFAERYRLQTLQEKKLFDESQVAATKQYEERKPKPEQTLDKLVNALGSKQRETNEVIDQFRMLVLSRNLSLPEYAETELMVEYVKPTTTTSGWESIQTITTRIRELDSGVRKARIVYVSGSIIPWLVGIVIAIAAGGFVFKSSPEPFWLGPAIGLGLSILLPISMILAMMPRVKRSMLIPYRQMMQQSWVLRKTSDDVRALAERNCRAEQARLSLDYQMRQKQVTDDYQKMYSKLHQTFTNDRSRLATEQAKLRYSAVTTLDESLLAVDKEQAPLLAWLQDANRVSSQLHADQFHHALEELHEKEIREIDRIGYRARRGTTKATEVINQDLATLTSQFPDWSSPLWLEGDWQRDPTASTFPIGQMSIDFNESLPPGGEVNEHLPEGIATPTKARDDASSIRLSMPISYDVFRHGTLAILANRVNRDTASQVIQNLLARGVTRIPMGSLHLTIIDPEGLGRDYGWLMPLADADPRLVTHRVWTQSSQISQQLSLIAYQNEEIIQQRLRDRYANLLDYNADAGPMAEPFRWIVWANFPFGLDEQSWKSLCSIFLSGPRCGIGVLLTIDPDQAWPVFAEKQKIIEQGLCIELKSRNTSRHGGSEPHTFGFLRDSVRGMYPIVLDLPPAPERLGKIIEFCKEGALKAGKIEVPFSQLAVETSVIGINKSSDGLIIPLGIAGVGRIQTMRLGTGTAQHVLVAGKTGSGKSSLLHTLITSAALQYGPDELRFVLMDFKKGVEFQVYAHSAMPQADIIGIESRREFGLSALEYLDRVMTIRGEMFRECGVQDVPNWCKVKPNVAMPRVLVVIDEFQEMFVEDDKLAQKSAMLLDRIVRQGRSFGIHMILASQTLGGSYSLPRTTLAQMAVRIALQCDGADAMLILGEDNMAASRLRHSGQAIYNDAGGRIESNQPFQVAYLSSKDHVGVLEAINQSITSRSVSTRIQDPSTSSLGRQIIFEGHRSAIWNLSDVERGWNAEKSKDSQATMMVLGESLSIEPTIVKSLSRQSGRNVAIVGSDDAIIANLVGSIWRGWHERVDRDSVPQICFLDGSRAEDRFAAELRPRFEEYFQPVSIEGQDWNSTDELSSCLFADYRRCDPMLAWLGNELDRRLAKPELQHRSLCFFVSNLSRFRELRRSEDFSFGSSMDATAAPTAEAIFTRLLREGPALGMHSIVCSDSAGNLGRWIPRQGMRDLEIRMLCQLSNNDSNALIDSGAANRLEPHAVIYYDEVDGKVLKVRPYRLTS